MNTEFYVQFVNGLYQFLHLKVGARIILKLISEVVPVRD
jgi:hypothetical protein